MTDPRTAQFGIARRAGARLVLTERRLFLWKSASVFVLSFALLPLVSMKSQVPAMTYASALVVLHIVIVGVYIYRVRFRDLDPDRRSLIARIGGLALTTYLLVAASKFNPESSLVTLGAQTLLLSLMHLVMLLLLMVRVDLAEQPLP